MVTDIDMGELEARLRAAYERGRARYALLVGAPIAAVALTVALTLGHDRMSLGTAVALAVSAPPLLWRGRFGERALLRGLVAGAIPLGVVLFARALGHVCTPSGCYSLCVPACIAGGAAAGLTLSRLVGSERHRLAGLAASGVFAWGVGALGCCCVSHGAYAGVAIGLAGAFGSLLRVVARPAK
jgi:hypothetical protein